MLQQVLKCEPSNPHIMNPKIALSPRLYFSYSQFMVFDESVRLPGCEWTDEHCAQGFARRESTVNFSTILKFGEADVVVDSAYQERDEYERVIAVPFLVTSGNVIVDGPEEIKGKRKLKLRSGNYRLTAAQRVTGEEEEAIGLFFKLLSKPLERSSILVADKTLRMPSLLSETAGIAGKY
jgi:hypothetical protein